jgi:3-hydroxyacyl-CoA dehydrogenase/enoyl-CoA hydratase/3-hydroxybutyryl-CoA epimerase
METLRITTDSDSITTIWLDVPAKGVNTLSPRVLAELSGALDQIESSPPRGLIFASAKDHSFIAGADLFEIRGMNHEQMLQSLADGQRLFSRIANLKTPTVAAINGDCLGGGLELSLACNIRVAAADTSIAIGLPEIKLGILPGWGGTVRLTALIGLSRALPLILAGKTLPPKKALRAGIVDEVVRPEALLAAAKRLVTGKLPQRRLSLIDRTAASVSLVRNKILARARKETLAATMGHYPAPLKVIDVVRRGMEQGQDAGFEAEREAVGELIATPAAQNLFRLFFLKQGAKRQIADTLRVKPAEVKRAAVIGGGTMGAGIAHALIRSNIDVRLIEVNSNAMSAALSRIKKLVDDDVAAGRIDRLAARNAMNRLAPSTDWTGLHLVDFVIEAAQEEINAKREIFARLDRLTRPDAVLATNTSSLSITQMAAATGSPQRVVGMHFFNPVSKMPLVEVVRTDLSHDEPLATTAVLASRLGKTPLLVRDAPGFLVNRILTPYLAEALAVAGEGFPIDQIDAALKEWGMPMGPFELLDTIGLDVAAHVLKTLGAVLHDPPPMPQALQLALDRKWLGDKTGRGFYEHDAKQTRTKALVVNSELQRALWPFGVPAGSTVDSHSSGTPGEGHELAWRLVLPMVNEAAHVLEERITDSADAIDLATVLGLGLAPFRGGLIQFANTVGTPTIVGKLTQLQKQFGPHFAPAELLKNDAAQNHPLAAPPAPPQRSSASLYAGVT